MKRIFAVCILLAMSTFLTACGGPAAAEGGDGTYQTIELTMAVNGTDNQIDARVGDYFAQLVSERSGGQCHRGGLPQRSAGQRQRLPGHRDDRLRQH